MKDIAIAIPVLGRQYHIDPLLESIHSTTPNARVVFITSTNDTSGVVEYLKEIDQEVMEIKSKSVRTGNKMWNFADYPRKINHAFRNTNEPLFFMGATDIKFSSGWFELATGDVTDKHQAIGTKDGLNARTMRGQHSTHSLITREYGELGTIDDPDCVLHEGYWHEFVDDEFCATAKHRGAFFSSKAQVLHVNRKRDPNYKNVRIRMVQGRAEWRERAPLIPGAESHKPDRARRPRPQRKRRRV